MNKREDQGNRRVRRRPTQGYCYWCLAVGAALIAGLTMGSSSAAAEGWQDQITLTLSERMRGEFVDWFQPPADKAPAGVQRYDFFASQLRVGAKVSAPHTLFTVEVQDTQLVNLPNDANLADRKLPQGNLGPGALYFFNTHQRDQGEVFLKQAHMTVNGLPGLSEGSATFGRFEYSDGMETVPTDPSLAWLKRARIGDRLVGPFGYTHVTRSFDGVRMAYDQPDFNITAMGTRPTNGGFEVSANREMDVWLAGLALTLKKIENLAPIDARLFYLYYLDQRSHVIPGVSSALMVDNRSTVTSQDTLRKQDNGAIDVHTWGGHVVTVADAGPGKVDGLLWGALQGGEWGQLHHFAWAYAVESGYQFPKVFAAPWLRVGYDRSSGDTDPNDKSHHTFFQILPTARAYAQLPFFNLMNTEDLFGQFILKPQEKVTVRTDYHWLRLTSSKDLWYAGGGATNNQIFGFTGIAPHGQRELAHLADISFTISILKQLTAYAYYGRAFGQSVVKRTFPDAGGANYGYIELTYRY